MTVLYVGELCCNPKDGTFTKHIHEFPRHVFFNNMALSEGRIPAPYFIVCWNTDMEEISADLEKLREKYEGLINKKLQLDQKTQSLVNSKSSARRL